MVTALLSSFTCGLLKKLAVILQQSFQNGGQHHYDSKQQKVVALSVLHFEVFLHTFISITASIWTTVI